ncbi:MAG: MFS transporter [Deltaproteobacteria bacterium]|nr:MFS transporter [Deltaproteobacteria bacterium]
MHKVLEESISIAVLVGAIALVVRRLPKIEVGHSAAFRARRLRNWVPVGLLYALLYMGRYNLTVAKSVFSKMIGSDGAPLMDNPDFATIFGVGTAVYGVAFVINGPLTDRIGGKRSLLLGAWGSIFANIVLGIITWMQPEGGIATSFTFVYALNMYFQSFGAVAIVKINAPWFHVRERGTFGAIFGILIALGLYLALDVGKLIVDGIALEWVFFAPAVLLSVLAVITTAWVRDTPSQAGFEESDTADASSCDDGPRLPVTTVFAQMLRHPVIMTIAAIEFCTGFLRQAILQWYRAFVEATGNTDGFVYAHWGMVSCCAGILGGVFAGVLSDQLFQSRRGPVSAVLYGFMVVGSVVAVLVLDSPLLGPVFAFMSMCVIGVHGMLTATASMDFGGRRNAGVAVGIIDGFVYAGTAAMSFTYGQLLPTKDAAKVVANWLAWPLTMVPVALIGFVLARRVWHAKPSPKRAAAPAEPAAR